jgi:hypothetical protein
MRCLIVHESMFGNTEQIATAIAAGLTDAGAEVTLAEVGHVDERLAGEVDVLVLGGPTHAFSMSRRSTRDDAVQRGGAAEHAATGMREWLAGLATNGPRPLAAVFDTRVDKVRHLPGSAARRAAKVLRARGFSLLDEPTSFYVADVEGPLVHGEIERAHAWGCRIAALAGRPSSGVTAG